MENGETAMEASLRGASEIGFTVISLTVSLIAVFIPLLFMTGIVGRMFREFALTLTIAVVTSAVVSLTLTPMMCSRLLRHQAESAGNAVTRWFSGSIDALVNGYRHTLEWVLRHQFMTLAVTVGTLVATIWLYVIVPKGFLPLQDTGLVYAVMEGGQDVSFTEMQRLRSEVEAAIRKEATQWARDFDANSLIILAKALQKFDVTTQLGRIKAKVLYVLSRTDRLFPPELAPGVMQSLGDAGVDAEYFLLDSEYGHTASGIDAAKWAPRLRQFMERLSPPR